MSAAIVLTSFSGVPSGWKALPNRLRELEQILMATGQSSFSQGDPHFLLWSTNVGHSENIQIGHTTVRDDNSMENDFPFRINSLFRETKTCFDSSKSSWIWSCARETMNEFNVKINILLFQRVDYERAWRMMMLSPHSLFLWRTQKWNRSNFFRFSEDLSQECLADIGTGPHGTSVWPNSPDWILSVIHREVSCCDHSNILVLVRCRRLALCLPRRVRNRGPSVVGNDQLPG